MRNVYNSFVGKIEGKRSLGRPRCRWEENIGMEPREVGKEVVGWFHLAQNKDQWRGFVNTIMYLRVP
jgi:hypothetical protein